MDEKGAHLSQLTSTGEADVIIYCDASDVGFGGHLTYGSKEESVETAMCGMWSGIEMKQSSTSRKL